MLNLDPYNHKPLREIVYEELREMILTGNIKPGTRLMEVEMAEEMGVSRTPIREAIRKLEKEGLVIIEPRRGAYVSEMSVKDMIDILEVRSNLEGLAACLAAERITKKELEELSSVADDFAASVEKDDMSGMIKSDINFHRIIVEASRNKPLIDMVEELQELVLRFRYIYYQDFRRAKEMLPEHKGILAAIKEGQPESAKEGAFSHIDRLKEMIMREEL